MKSLKNYIIEKHYNSPDSIKVNMGDGKNKVFNFKDKNARPFIYVMKKSKVLFGEPKETHGDLITNLESNNQELCKKLELQDAYKDVGLKGFPDIYFGRTWDIVIDNQPSLFLAWWDELSDKEFLDYNKAVIDDYFVEKLNTNESKIKYKFYCLDNNGKIFELNNNEKIKIEKRTNQSKELINTALIIHNADQKAKKEFFVNFKKMRDEKNQKIYNHTKSKTEAEYRALKYQESLEE